MREWSERVPISNVDERCGEFARAAHDIARIAQRSEHGAAVTKVGRFTARLDDVVAVDLPTRFDSPFAIGGEEDGA